MVREKSRYILAVFATGDNSNGGQIAIFYGKICVSSKATVHQNAPPLFVQDHAIRRSKIDIKIVIVFQGILRIHVYQIVILEI